ncbi:MAG TPA: hypothetical protein VNI77_06525 [Nitrososphaera sp.]|nr:hypothetical protein [Nitrososphaera sp.]
MFFVVCGPFLDKNDRIGGTSDHNALTFSRQFSEVPSGGKGGSNPLSGTHSIMVASMDRNIEYFIYGRILDYLSDGRAVIYLAESAPSHVMRQISRAMDRKQQPRRRHVNTKDLREYVTGGALTVIDREEFYSSVEGATPQFGVNRLIRSLYSLISEARGKRSRGRTNRPERVVTISACASFLQRKGVQAVLEYEKQLQHSNVFGKSVEFICWYNDLKLFERLPFSSLLYILNAHDATIHTGWKYRRWYSDDIFGYVRDGLDNVLGAGTAYLIFKTLKMVYNVDPVEVITSRPELFEEKITRVLGERTAENVLKMIADAIRKEMAYGGIAYMR